MPNHTVQHAARQQPMPANMAAAAGGPQPSGPGIAQPQQNIAPNQATSGAPTSDPGQALQNLLQEGGAYLTQARQQASRAAAGRGLANTSLAAQAAQGAAIQAGLPIAQQQATQTYQSGEREKDRTFTSGQTEQERQFVADQAEKDRQFTTGERTGTQEFETEQQRIAREAAEAEAERQRQFTTGERTGTQEYETEQQRIARETALEEAERQRQFTTGEREQTQKFTGTQQEIARQFQEQENQRLRDFNSDEAKQERKFQADETARTRDFGADQARVDRQFQEDRDALARQFEQQQLGQRTAANLQGQYTQATQGILNQYAISINEIETAQDISTADKNALIAAEIQRRDADMAFTRQMYSAMPTWQANWVNQDRFPDAPGVGAGSQTAEQAGASGSQTAAQAGQ